MAGVAMNEQTQLKAFVAFLFVFSVMALSQTVHAAMAMTPMVSGYSSSSGTYSAPSGSFSTAANSASYGSTGVISVGGKPITVPASLRMASNAGQMAVAGMKATPWGLVGTLAAGFLLDQGLKYVDGQGWLVETKPEGQFYPAGTCPINATFPCYTTGPHPPDNTSQCISSGGSNYGVFNSGSGWQGYCVISPAHQWPTRPATQPDWDALPDPLPVVAPELPYAPYMPEGVPVEAPEFDFAPFTAPLGSPYTKPDGSTAQPSAKVSPNGDQVTVDTFDQPLTDPQGDPVPNPQPQDTPEPAPESKTDCDKYPTNIGCSKYGDIPAAETLPTLTVPVSPSVTPVGTAGMCPSSVVVGPVTWSYQPFCDFASAIRPLIIGFAWLSFAFIVVGAVRT